MPRKWHKGPMSNKNERAFRASRRILPVKVRVRQADGSVVVQVVDADVREDKRRSRRKAK